MIKIKLKDITGPWLSASKNWVMLATRWRYSNVEVSKTITLYNSDKAIKMATQILKDIISSSHFDSKEGDILKILVLIIGCV